MVFLTTPRRPRTPSDPATPASHAKAQQLPSSEKKRLNGTWKDGQWWCNCEPRKQAALREVTKKASRNKGRFFWTCPTYPFCDLFLWREDAILRETGLPAGSKHIGDDESVQSHRPKTPTFTQQPLESFGIQTSAARRLTISSAGGSDGSDGREEQASGTSSASPTTPSLKRKRMEQDEWGQDDNFSDLNSDDERKLAVITDESAKKAALKDAANDIFTTPTTSRHTTDIVAGLPTPSVSRTLFSASGSKRSKTVTFEDPVSSSMLTTPSKTSSTVSEASAVTPSGTHYDSTQGFTDQVMALLRGQKIDPTVLRTVHGLLDAASRKTKGIALGRDKTREALQKRDDKIAKLQDKIRSLENKAAFDHQNMTEAKRRIMQAYEGI
ncbi:hypothetical protein EsDP_00001603 [Epichloe bromicola]|uniref:GRF-type domain-containing protein n=1 Tax=Epichloe bromicola TaxID=79588 RepID=A0ABQ0CIC7_9HYPO